MTQPVLLQLQAADGEIDAALKRLAEIEAWFGDHSALEQAEHRARTSASLAAESRANLRSRELELKSMEARQSALEKKLYGGSIHNPKELESLERESQMLQHSHGKLEDGVLSLMDSTEQVEHEAHDLQAQWERASEARALAEQARAQERAVLTQNIATRRATVEALRARLKPEQVDTYDRMRKRGGLVVAAVQGHRCGACGITLAQTVVELAREPDSLVQCDSCGRILCSE